MSVVSEILDAISLGGLTAALEYTQQFDGVTLSPGDVVWNPMMVSPPSLSPAEQHAIDFAVKQIVAFHRATHPKDTILHPAPGLILSERFVPLDRVGVYVPNGGYPLISSLLMTAVPAQVAGVPEIVVAIPPRGEVSRNPLWLYALQSLKISTVVSLGGAQAVGLMAYGCPELPAVDLIAGPGNAYVAEAKREIFRRGLAGIDVIAGPSEVLVICDDPTYADIAALDLLAQAEHAIDARAVLVSWDKDVLRRAQSLVSSVSTERPLGRIEMVPVSSPDEAVQLAQRMAPEHLGLMGTEAESLLPRLTTAGAIFVGPMAGQALGDYVAGPSHVLPTGGTGRFLSGLSTRTFMRRASIIEASSDLPEAYLEAGQTLAELEGLDFHRQSLARRQDRLHTERE